MSGSRRTISAPSAMMRSLPSGSRASSAKQSSPPAIVSSSETQRMALMCGSSHSSKNTLGRRGNLRAAASISCSRARMSSSSTSPRASWPTIAATWYSIEKISAMLRWLNTVTCTPRRISSAAMSACRSEKPNTQSGRSSRIFSILAEVNALTLGFSSRARRGRTV